MVSIGFSDKNLNRIFMLIAKTIFFSFVIFLMTPHFICSQTFQTDLIYLDQQQKKQQALKAAQEKKRRLAQQYLQSLNGYVGYQQYVQYKKELAKARKQAKLSQFFAPEEEQWEKYLKGRKNIQNQHVRIERQRLYETFRIRVEDQPRYSQFLTKQNQTQSFRKEQKQIFLEELEQSRKIEYQQFKSYNDRKKRKSLREKQKKPIPQREYQYFNAQLQKKNTLLEENSRDVSIVNRRSQQQLKQRTKLFNQYQQQAVLKMQKQQSENMR